MKNKLVIQTSVFGRYLFKKMNQVILSIWRKQLVVFVTNHKIQAFQKIRTLQNLFLLHWVWESYYLETFLMRLMSILMNEFSALH